MTHRFTLSFFAMGAILFAGALVARAAAPTTNESWRNDPKHEARRLVAEAADRSIQKDAVNKILELVNKKDRDRIEKEIDKKEEAKYQEAADKVQAMWKEKYGHAFDAQGHVNDLKNLKVTFSGKGRDEKAVIQFPAEPGESAYEIHLMKESTGYWRFELPDTLTGQNFYNELTKSLQKVVDEKEKLPAAADQGYERASAWLLHELVFPATGEAVPAAEKK
jgi:hypothetical protein